jgi:hypothetical protein
MMLFLHYIPVVAVKEVNRNKLRNYHALSERPILKAADIMDLLEGPPLLRVTVRYCNRKMASSWDALSLASIVIFT